MRIVVFVVCSSHVNAKQISRQCIINGWMQEMYNRKIAMLHVPCGTCVSATRRRKKKGIKMGKQKKESHHNANTNSPHKYWNIISSSNSNQMVIKPRLCSKINCCCICLLSSLMASASSFQAIREKLFFSLENSNYFWQNKCLHIFKFSSVKCIAYGIACMKQ